MKEVRKGDVCTIGMMVGRTKIYVPWKVEDLADGRAALSYGTMKTVCPLSTLEGASKAQNDLFDQAWG